MDTDELYMHRCIELAKQGAGYVMPNPMVGAVLVHDGNIIGEGYHHIYGGAHAEVNCLQSVKESEVPLISKSTLYVSLEPCSHFGKTPPCADLIIKNNIPRVVVGCRDPFKDVNGKGIEKLQNAGTEVVSDVLYKECIELNKRFFIFHTQHRPYVILKWAQSANKKISGNKQSRVLISNEVTNRLVHKWRSGEAAIMVGTNTALYDNPHLNARKWKGNNPLRLVADIHLRLPSSLKIYDQKQQTIIINKLQHKEEGNILYYQVTEDESLVQQVINACYQLNIQSVLVEGGALLLQSFIDESAWDEARIITNNTMVIPGGLSAPLLNDYYFSSAENILADTIHYCLPSKQT